MKLVEYQRAVVRVSFAVEPNANDLSALGNASRFLMYREMIRTRLEGMARVAFKHTLESVGDEAFAASFARYLASASPHSPLIRDVVADYGPFARSDAELLADTPALARDLLAFEEAKWRVAYRTAAPSSTQQEPLRELDFESLPVFNPAFIALSLEHPVHELHRQSARAEPLTLFVYRPPELDDIRWYKAEPFFAALVARMQASPEPVVDSLRRTAEAEAREIDEALLESLATSLTLAVERGVILGARKCP